MGFLDDLYKNHGNDVEEQMSSELGIPRDRAAQILPQAAPLILAQLKRRMEQHGPAQVEREMEEAHGDLDMDDIGAILRRGRDQASVYGDPRQQQQQQQQAPQSGGTLQDLLGALLRGNGAQATQQHLSNQLGVSPGMAAKIIPMVAPLILSALMKSRGQAQQQQQQQQQGGGYAPQQQGQAPSGGGVGGILASILDKNGDGNILDDLLRGGAGSVLGGMAGGGQPGAAGKSGCLGAILSGLLGGGRR